MKSRLSIAVPGVALALFAIAAAQAAPAAPPPPVGQASEPTPVAAQHLSEMEARMKLMQQQMRRIRETKSPQLRAKLLREHMNTMMAQMQAMRALGGPTMAAMMPRQMMGGPALGRRKMGGGMMSGGNRNASAEQCQQMRERMQNRLDMMQMMMEQMTGQMQAIQGTMMGERSPAR